MTLEEAAQLRDTLMNMVNDAMLELPPPKGKERVYRGSKS